ncbi:MAG: nucleotidyltransferase domain-containing protein [Candidatus Thorarchaeota archaeon]
MRRVLLCDTYRITMVANELVQRVSHFTSVEGIIYMGGLVRGFADKYSDVDIIVLLNNEDPYTRDFLPSVSANLEDKSNLEIDVEVYLFESFNNRDWNEYQKWDLSHSEVAFDRHGRVTTMLKDKLSMSDNEWRVRISKAIVYFSWYCCAADEYTPTMIDMWMDRGDVVSAEYAVNYGIELILDLVYTLNKSFLPAPKWRFGYTRTLDWLPKEFEEHMREALICKELSDQDAHRRALGLKMMWPEFLEKAEKDFGLSRDEVRRIYINAVYST